MSHNEALEWVEAALAHREARHNLAQLVVERATRRSEVIRPFHETADNEPEDNEEDERIDR